jgi:hypothetical protein
MESKMGRLHRDRRTGEEAVLAASEQYQESLAMLEDAVSRVDANTIDTNVVITQLAGPPLQVHELRRGAKMSPAKFTVVLAAAMDAGLVRVYGTGDHAKVELTDLGEALQTIQ